MTHLVTPDAPEWSTALAAVPHDVYHLPGYASVDGRHRKARACAFVYREGARALLQPLLVRPVPDSDLLDAVSPYGYSGPVSNAGQGDRDFWRRAMRSMVTTLRAHRIVTVFVRLHPLLAVPHDVLGDVGTLVRHGDTVSVDLRLPAEEIWRRTRKAHRNAINRARRAGLTVLVDDWSHLGAFVAAYHATMRRLDADDTYFFGIDYFTGLRAALGDRVHLAAALLDNTFVGGSIFFHHGPFGHAHLVGTTAVGQARGAGKLLDDEERWWVRAHGGAVYHLGGGFGGERDPLFAYKSGFSDRTHPFFTWRVVTDRIAYGRLLRCPVPAEGPLDLSGFFPPYRRLPSLATA
jgi:hypothetical protein